MKTQMTDKQRDYLRKIQSSSQHLLGILNDILDFSKIEAGKLTIENIEFNLENVLSNISQLVHEKATEKGLELIFDVAPDVPNHLIGDPLRLGQVLINFGTNAIKFTEKGEIAVIIRKLEETEKDVLIKLTVKDTGIGLSAEQTKKLFQSFQQADTSTTRKYGGTGLGLAICKNLAQMMDGEVGVESQLGEGSQFWFTARLGKSSQTHHGLVPHPDLRGKRVLVVDDNENARTVIATLLDSMSFHVCEANSGKNAIELTQKSAQESQPFDAIFLDWQMPNMDGIEVARVLQNKNLSPMPKLLLVTAYGREEVLQNAISAGFDEVLLKPVNASMLLDSMARVFGADVSQTSIFDTSFVEVQDLSAIVGAQILVVEDNDINQEIAKELLESEGFEVEIAENGQIAIEKIQQNHYDIVLMDMQMPVMDGVSATIKIRKLPRFNHLPIIAMTANAMQQDKEICFAAGMNDHISKPIDPNDLWTALAKWIRPRQSKSNVKITTKTPIETVVIPNNIDGLDTELGLRRVLNKHEFYVSILKSFVNTQENAIGQIQTALDLGDSQTALRTAHTLKGLLGNIGALALQEFAGKIETAIKDNAPRETIENEFLQLAPQLTQLIEALKKQLNLEPLQQVNEKKVDLEQLQTVAQKLAAYFAEGDAESIDYFSQHANLLNSAFPKAFKMLQVKIDNYDFPDALELLKDAAAQHQITL
jgi:CheY-like chemotaxis protein